MWIRYGNIWVMQEMPIITIEPFPVLGKPGNPKNRFLWKACCGGHPVEQIEPSASSAEVMMRAEKYYDARIDVTTVKQPWR